MERELQERVIGAVVLVVVAVLIVPVFLDGSGEDVAISAEGVTLPGQNSAQPVTQKVVLNRDRSEPVPVNSPAPVAAPEVEVQPDEQELAPPPPAIEQPDATVAPSVTGMWAVQLGSFSQQENAERLAASLRQEGYAAFLSQTDTPEGELHRVRVGPQKDRAGAESVLAQLGKSGHRGQVVPHP